MVRMQIICKMSVNTTLSQQHISYSRIKVTSGLRTAFNSSPFRLSVVVLVLFGPSVLLKHYHIQSASLRAIGKREWAVCRQTGKEWGFGGILDIFLFSTA